MALDFEKDSQIWHQKCEPQKKKKKQMIGLYQN